MKRITETFKIDEVEDNEITEVEDNKDETKEA